MSATTLIATRGDRQNPNFERQDVYYCPRCRDAQHPDGIFKWDELCQHIPAATVTKSLKPKQVKPEVVSEILPEVETEIKITRAYGVEPALANDDFKLPAVDGSDWDYVLGPLPGQIDGWFPRGDLSLIGGSSGTNKSTLIIDLLVTQALRQKFLGHETFGLPYLILMTDRGERAYRRTMKRMRLDDKNIPASRVRSGTDEAALRDIVDKIEAATPFPAVVFLEGADMMVEDAAKMHFVTPFVDGLHKIASHYHLAIIGSVGAAKFKKGEGYATKRDIIFGSQAWGRKAETIAVLQYPTDHDETSDRRELTVVPRNAPTESFSMIFRNGRLELATPEDQKAIMAPEVEWFMSRTADPDTEWWTAGDLEAGLNMSPATAFRKVKEALAKKILRKKTGPREGAAALYQWNDDTATNPLLRAKKLAQANF